MHFSLLEKLGASLLICAWLIYGSNVFGNLLVRVESPEKTAVASAGPSGKTGKQAAAPEKQADFAVLLASADAKAGEKAFKKCASCHNVEKGQGAKIGPDLWGVVGRPKAHEPGFSYSAALSGLGGEWTYDDLNKFLESPKNYAPGTKMTYAGVGDPKERAEIVAFLRSKSDSPPPLPEAPKATAEAAPAAPAVAPAETGEEAEGQPAAAQAVAENKPSEGESAKGGADFHALLASADAAAGEKVFGKCKSCHNAEKGGKNQVGPHLWGVVGRPKASVEDFAYSNALKSAGGEWTYDDLNGYLANPKQFAPGNKMTFAGLTKPEDRAAVIAYLRKQSDSPRPLP